MKTLGIVQARMNSTRLPGKVLKKIDGIPLIEILLYRLSRSKKLDSIILATSENHENDILVEEVERLGFEVFRGNEDDVLDRYYKAAMNYHPNAVVRITGDCPIIDSDLVDDVIGLFEQNSADFACNTAPPSYPDGLDVEVFTFGALELAQHQANKLFEREHVTPFMRDSKAFTQANLSNDVNHSNLRWTVDEEEDLEVIANVVRYFSPSRNFSWREVLDLSNSHPELFLANQGIQRNEGAILGTGQKLWRRAKKLIPGGNMLLSKRAEMFLPEKWPAYFSKTKGCAVWDLDGKRYYDMSLMGVGTNVLGYSHPEVDEAVRNVIDNGNLSTLNCAEEVHLAERLISLHPWADMVRLARSGGEANSIAARIARAASGKDKIAFCGYHGWHDWYLAANLGDETRLDGHLLPGLEPRGVPRSLQGTVVTFRYNDIAGLNRLVDGDQNIGVIKMEVSRSEEPNPGFLRSVRELCSEKGIVLIFDECTSGFRETFGGLHKKYNVEPDLAIFSKALGNGYAISAVVGRREVMEAAQRTFISSTFWTERIGPTAALKTLEVMERDHSWKTIVRIGADVITRWRGLADRHGLHMEVSGLVTMPKFTILGDDWLKYKTLITQELLNKGFLASDTFYASTAHRKEIVDEYFEALDPVFELIAECKVGKNVDLFLKEPVCHSGFQRLN